MSPIGSILQQARAVDDAACLRRVRQALYGTRRSVDTSASDAPDVDSASGRGPRSVWQGARAARVPGAPMLRRY